MGKREAYSTGEETAAGEGELKVGSKRGDCDGGKQLW